MNILDVMLAIIILVGAVAGYQKGFLYSLFSLLAIFLGVLGGFKLMGIVMVKLSLYYEIDSRILPYAAFALVFVLIAVIVRLLGSLLRSSLEKTTLGRADQAAGALLGSVKTIFMISIMLWLTESVSLELPGHWRNESSLYGFVANFAPKTTHWIGEFMPAFSDLFRPGTE
ncbi:MAG: CvpA family protein [Flammeovirgaceae bacterium]|nr:MAG: CvpA family protein [Flammeovirgaceae bacterium]